MKHTPVDQTVERVARELLAQGYHEQTMYGSEEAVREEDFVPTIEDDAALWAIKQALARTPSPQPDQETVERLIERLDRGGVLETLRDLPVTEASENCPANLRDYAIPGWLRDYCYVTLATLNPGIGGEVEKLPHRRVLRIEHQGQTPVAAVYEEDGIEVMRCTIAPFGFSLNYTETPALSTPAEQEADRG
jgi:hypothetical protein